MDSNKDTESPNPQPDILAPDEELEVYLVRYRVNLRGELSGCISVSGQMLRKASSVQKAMQDVHLFLARNPCSMYPLISSYGLIELTTPEFPPSFSGRTIKDIRVCGGRFDHTSPTLILNHEPNDIPDNSDPDPGNAHIFR